MRITRYLSNEMILRELGSRIRDQRIARSVTQEDLSEKAGVSLSTIVRMENGKGCSLGAFLSVCRILGMTENLDLLIPEYQERPTEILDRKKKRQRASKSKASRETWVWGEDKG